MTEMYFLILLETVQDQGAHRVGFWWDRSSWLVNGPILTVSSRGLPSGTRAESPLWCVFL